MRSCTCCFNWSFIAITIYSSRYRKRPVWGAYIGGSFKVVGRIASIRMDPIGSTDEYSIHMVESARYYRRPRTVHGESGQRSFGLRHASGHRVIGRRGKC